MHKKVNTEPANLVCCCSN